VPQILIRELDSEVVRKLRANAAAKGVSVEEEARRILRRSLMDDVVAMPLIDFLRTMPDVDDRIFRRPKRKPRKIAGRSSYPRCYCSTHASQFLASRR